MNIDFYHLMARWKILEAIAADTVPLDTSSKPYATFELSPEAKKILKIDVDKES